MRSLLRLISLRYVRANPSRTFLTLFGIMLGVAVVFAIDVVNSSVMSSFRSAMETISGKTALTVSGPTGIPEELLEQVRAVPGVTTAVPVIEENAHDLNHDAQLVVLGVDTLSDSEVRDYEVTADDVKIEDDVAFLNDPHGVIVTTSFAKRHNVKNGDVLTLETVSGKHDYTVRGTLAARGSAKVFGGDLLLMDVYAAQIAFGRERRFDRIDVVAAADIQVDVLQKRIEDLLEGKANVARPERRTEETERLMAGFKLSLSLASLVAMFVGGFIVYNALAIAVAQRRREIGILRALGTTRAQILVLFVGEGLLLGLIGAAVGLGFGMLLARWVLKLAAGTISALYVAVEANELVITPRDMIVATSIGVAVAVFAAWFPARRASFVDPASIMRKTAENSAGAAPASFGVSLGVGAMLSLLAVCVALGAHIRESASLGYAVAAVGAFASAFYAPALARGIGSLARRLLGRSDPALLLGSVGFMRNAGRNSIAIAALGMSLANAVNADAMIGSMKHNTSRWLDRTARADLFVFAGEEIKANVDHPLPESVGDELGRIPGVRQVEYGRRIRDSFKGEPYFLGSVDMRAYCEQNDMPVAEGDLQRALTLIEEGKGLSASQNFVNSFHVGLGSHITLQTPKGPQTFEIVLVHIDYGSELGVLMTTRSVYKRIWGDTLVDSFGLYAQKGANISEIREQVLASLGKRYRLMALTNGQYKSELMGVLDGSFALARATELVAIIVAILGIINTLLVTVMDRRTEIAMLKVIGAVKEQLQHMLIIEGALIGFAASVLGVVFGSVFSAYVVKELMRLEVGWQMSWQLSGWALLQTFVIAQVVSLLSVWWPLRSATRIDSVTALQNE